VIPMDCLGCAGILASVLSGGLAWLWPVHPRTALYLYTISGGALAVSALAYLDQIRP